MGRIRTRSSRAEVPLGTEAIGQSAALKRARRSKTYAPVVHDDAVFFRIVDEDEALTRVRLSQEIQRPRLGPDFLFDKTTKTWSLRFPRPEADRIEYMFVLTHKDGGDEWIPDPANPLRAGGPFGDKSVIEFPGYRPPSWIDAPPVSSEDIVETEIKSRTLRAKLRTQLWMTPGAEPDEPLPLLIAHDGPEYNELSDLLKLLQLRHDEGLLPKMRVALIAPHDRDQTYSASAVYARALAYEIMPALDRLAPTPHGRSQRIGMGASLGALAMLHVHRNNPATFGALYLQSGSYFRQRYDKQESGFPRFGRISRFMGRVLTAEEWAHPIRVTITCGTVEENLMNNRATAKALERQGYDLRFVENRDAHNWIGWRDTFDPHLVDMLRRTWVTGS